MFLTGGRADADRSPWGDFWFSPPGARSAAGARVTPASAMQLSAVFACVRVIAESFAILPAALYRPKVGGGRQRVTDHWLVRLLTRRPNRFQTPFEWREMLQGHLSLRGNAFCEIVEDGRGGISELLPLHPDRMKVEVLPSGEYRYRYTAPDGSATVYRRGDVWHLRGLSGDGIVGYSPIEVAREAIGEGLQMQSYSSTFYANDARPAGWVEYPGRFQNDAAKETFRQSWGKVYGGVNRGRVAVLEHGMKYHEIGVSNRDAQFLEGRKFKVGEIARIFRVPPHKIGDLERATHSNIEHQGIEFWQDTMLPWSERWESSIESTLLGDGQDIEVEFEFRRLLRGDAISRAQYLHNLVLDGVITRNEARAEEGYDPIDGLDEPLVPVNERELSAPDPNAPDPANEPADPTDGPPDDEGDDASARLAVVVRANAARLARRIAAGQPVPAPMLAEALAVPVGMAAGWSAKGEESSIAASLRSLGGVE